MPGDTVSFDKGNVFIQPQGYSAKVREESFRIESGYDIPMKRQIPQIDYEAFSTAAAIKAYEIKNVRIPFYLVKIPIQNSKNFTDWYHINKELYAMQKKIDPSDFRIQSLAARYKNGFYIPENYILPFGDNRDNSFDGRYFGPVQFKDVLGKTIFRFWPLNRIGLVN